MCTKYRFHRVYLKTLSEGELAARHAVLRESLAAEPEFVNV
jgi:hypothetical protein